ncbi:MAG: hypothetical protein AABY22_15560, partial [Nanoarchaeota archaeon]
GVCDVRFKEEIDGIHSLGGKVIYFTRTTEQNSEHSSNKADISSLCDIIIDNKEIEMDKKNEAIFAKLREWGYLEYDVVTKESA